MRREKAGPGRKKRKKGVRISSGSFLDIDIESTDVHRGEALRHSKIYTQLLLIYKSSIRCNVILKGLFKALFFFATMIAFGFVVYFFCTSLKQVSSLLVMLSVDKRLDLESILGMVTVVVPAAVSLIVALIKIPKIIAKYLFDAREDNHVDSVIKNIQTYDATIFKIEVESGDLINVVRRGESSKNDKLDVHIDPLPEPSVPANDSHGSSA